MSKKLSIFLFSLSFFSLTCQFSSNEKAISKDICHCVTDLVAVNEQIQHAINNDPNGDVMRLFVKAGEENKKAMDCILSLSNSYGNIDKEKYGAIIDELNRSCREGVEAFQKSGWYVESKK